MSTRKLVSFLSWAIPIAITIAIGRAIYLGEWLWLLKLAVYLFLGGIVGIVIAVIIAFYLMKRAEKKSLIG